MSTAPAEPTRAPFDDRPVAGGFGRDDRPVAAEVRFGAATFPDPVFTASGCAAAGRELAQFFPLASIGGVVTKSVMLAPRSGRPTPRMVETTGGMLNSIGLQGPGIDAFLAEDLPALLALGGRAVVSLAGGSVGEYAKLADRVADVDGVSAVEVNISCPNVEDRGLVFACDPRASAAVVAAVRRAVPPRVPVLAKLSPDVTDVTVVARACVDAGADGLTLVNTTLGLALDPVTLRPVLGGTTGGLSGPALKPVALRCVWQVHRALPDVPLMGVGGIRTGADALEFLAAGATAVQVGTAIFGDPDAPARVSAELRRAVRRAGYDHVGDVVGVAHRRGGGADERPGPPRVLDREPPIPEGALP